ncbi:hypothetical protein DENIT_12730 [Pseudomonas veronii]|nr:hypothetical protein DENIT_12730 [Pseudomonas veronii]
MIAHENGALPPDTLREKRAPEVVEMTIDAA